MQIFLAQLASCCLHGMCVGCAPAEIIERSLQAANTQISSFRAFLRSTSVCSCGLWGVRERISCMWFVFCLRWHGLRGVQRAVCTHRRPRCSGLVPNCPSGSKYWIDMVLSPSQLRAARSSCAPFWLSCSIRCAREKRGCQRGQ